MTPAETARATAPGWRRPRATAAVLVALGFLAGASVHLARNVIHGKVTAASLFESVEGRTPSAGGFLLGHPTGDRCAGGGRAWRCELLDSSGSATVTYRVTVGEGSSCWTARRETGAFEGHMPRLIDGCVRLWE